MKNEGVTLKFFHDDQKGLKQALLDGKIDIAYRGLAAAGHRGHRAGHLRRQSEHRRRRGHQRRGQHLVFNMKDPVAGKLGVRKAMAYLLDRDALVKDVYRDTATPLYSIVPAGIGGHTTAFFDTYGARPQRDKAAAALRAEGLNGKVKLTLWSTPSRYGPSTDQELKAIAKQLNASGLFDADVKSRQVRASTSGTSQSGKYGVYVKGWVPDYPDPDNFTQPFFGKGNVLGNHYRRTATSPGRSSPAPPPSATAPRPTRTTPSSRTPSPTSCRSCRSGRPSSTR